MFAICLKDSEYNEEKDLLNILKGADCMIPRSIADFYNFTEDELIKVSTDEICN